SGQKGQAHSEATEVISPTIEEILQSGSKTDALPFSKHIKNLAKIINATLEEDSISKREFDLVWSATIDARLFRDSLDFGLRENSLLKALLQIQTFERA